MPILFFLAQIDFKDALAANMHKTSASRNGLTLLFAAFGMITLLILVWAVFIRKRPAEASRRYSHSTGEHGSVGRNNPGASTSDHDRRRRRRRRRRPRNPTLSETGGLPPIRGEGFFEDPS